MQYLYAGLLILVGLVNLGLVRKGMETGRVQSRFMDIGRRDKPMAFWAAITLQCCISMIFFILAFHQINP